MPTLKGSQTLDTLKNAFASEAHANRRYLYFARQADIEVTLSSRGYFGANQATLIEVALKPVGDPVTNLPIGKTATNLESAIFGETREYTEVYPVMAKIAREEGFTEIADWFERLAGAEKNHAVRFRQGLKSINSLTV